MMERLRMEYAELTYSRTSILRILLLELRE
jgi:hypothetical protein